MQTLFIIIIIIIIGYIEISYFKLDKNYFNDDKYIDGLI